MAHVRSEERLGGVDLALVVNSYRDAHRLARRRADVGDRNCRQAFRVGIAVGRFAEIRHVDMHRERAYWLRWCVHRRVLRAAEHIDRDGVVLLWRVVRGPRADGKGWERRRRREEAGIRRLEAWDRATAIRRARDRA